MKTFEDYLREVHAKQYEGLDDDMTDNFDLWLDWLDKSDLIELADRFARELQK